MKRLLLIAVLALASCAVAAGRSGSGSAASKQVEQELMQLERDWSAAYLRHDTTAIERIIADDFVGFDGRGVLTDKAQEIEDAKGAKPGDPPPSFLILEDEVTDMKVRQYGDVAVVTGRSVEKVRLRDRETVIQYRRTTVWVKRHGRWQCVSFHGSRIVEPPRQ
jgi:ketosteroid isomerase-like protein